MVWWYYIAVGELKYGIYDGLEMKLKVTKMSYGTIMSSLQCDDDDDEWSIWLFCVLLISDAGSWKESKKSLKLYCNVLCCSFPLPNGLERSPFIECDIWFAGVLKGVWNSLCTYGPERSNFLKVDSHGVSILSIWGVSPWRIKTLYNPM